MKQELPIRIVLCQEGNMWNAYLEGAVLMGSIAIGAAQKDDKIKKAFQELMQNVLSNMIESIYGDEVVSMELREAPEHEKAGNA